MLAGRTRVLLYVAFEEVRLQRFLISCLRMKRHSSAHGLQSRFRVLGQVGCLPEAVPVFLSSLDILSTRLSSSGNDLALTNLARAAVRCPFTFFCSVYGYVRNQSPEFFANIQLNF